MKRFKNISITFLIFLIHAKVAYSRKQLRINGGEKTPDGRYPFMVSLQHKKGHFCGGAIIDENSILTAAHCVTEEKTGKFTKKQIYAVLGTSDAGNKGREVQVLKIKIKKMYKPKAYTPLNPHPGLPFQRPADIAVLKLEEPIQLEHNEVHLPQLEKINLPTDPDAQYMGEKLIIAGYGESGNKREELRFAYAKVLTNGECVSKYKLNVRQDHFCAQMSQRKPHRPEGTCDGDSGGPLFDSKTKTVKGVLSTGPVDCNENKTPSVYTKVSQFLYFIRAAINDKATDDADCVEWKKSTGCTHCTHKLVDCTKN
ncbi:chymotrypsinogen A-like [Trichogramma pretiosum]|uniref:chymotrypsinogen A-like n=1 Tax=Trichogramma pretiosum TaxID=7493 RepID=UPI000C71C5CE|nr:chymotrypsinogen A-like [Trichogramma pretiosum]